MSLWQPVYACLKSSVNGAVKRAFGAIIHIVIAHF